MDQIIFLNRDVVRMALPMKKAIDAMRDAFVALIKKKANIPERTLMKIHEHDATSLTMPVYSAIFGHISVKVVNAFNLNPSKGLDRVHGLLLLFDGKTGKPVAIFDGLAITAIRTGAASGLATDLMARQDAAAIAIIGAGVQGRTQLESACTVRAFRKAYVYDIDSSAAVRFADDMSRNLDLEVAVSDSVEAAVERADVICTATVSRSPVFMDQHIAPGTHINAIGSFKPDHQEIPEETLLRSRLVLDHRLSVLSESGDLIIPMKKGKLKESDVLMELGDLLVGQEAGRQDEQQVTLFKSVGSAIQDLAAASVALKIAQEQKLGEFVRV